MPSQASSSAALTPDDEAPPADEDGDREPVGVVFGDVDADRFQVAVRDPSLGRGAWVAADHPGRGAVLARVESVRRETDLSAEDAHRLDDPDAGSPDDQVTAQARVVAARGGAPPATPVPAGAPVRRAPASLVADALGLPDPDGPRPRGAYLGKVRGRDVDVVLDVEDLVRRHVSVLAKTGAGKSYLVGGLLEELAKEGVPAVVVDPHGEHDGLARPNRDEDAFPRMREFGVEPRQYADQLARFHPEPSAGQPEAEPLRLQAANLPMDELEQLAGDLTNAQQGLLHEALRTLRDRPAHYNLEDVARRVRESESSAKWSLLSSLEALSERPIFQGEPTDPGHLVARGQVSLVNLRGVDPGTAEMAVARLANTLFEARKRGEIPPFLLVVEEAHRFCPERGYDTSVAGPALRTVASEGRKFGMGCAIVSQRPAKVDKNVLSQCNTEIAMKVTNPRDVKALAGSLEGLTDGMADEIQRLPVGQAVVSHPDLRTPVITEVRPRETRPGGDRTPVVADAPTEAAGDAPAPGPDAFPDAEAEEDRPDAEVEVRLADDPGEEAEARETPDPGDGASGSAPGADEEPVPGEEVPAGEPAVDPPDAPPTLEPREPEPEPACDGEPDAADPEAAGDAEADEPQAEAPSEDPTDDPTGPATDEAPTEPEREAAGDDAAGPAPETALDPDHEDDDTELADEDEATGDPGDEAQPPAGPATGSEFDDATESGSDPGPADASDDGGPGGDPEVDAVLEVPPDPDPDPDAREDDTMDPDKAPRDASHDHADAGDRDPEAEADDPDSVLREAAQGDEDPDAADLDEATAGDPLEPERTIAAVREAEAILGDVDPDDLATGRLRRLVDEVEDLLTRLGRVGNRTPDVVEAHNGLAAELVRFRRVQARREANHPVDGVVRR